MCVPVEERTRGDVRSRAPLFRNGFDFLHADHPIPFYVPYTVVYDNSCADEVQRRGDRGA